jgi:hypothetical protein
LLAPTRRRFLGAAAGAAAIVAAPGLAPVAWAHARGTADPRPIPGGLQFLLPFDDTVFHVFAPGYPGLPDNDPATNDPSTITDFNGDVGLCFVGGAGTHTNKVTGEERHLEFEVDMRFMKGTYVGLDGRTHHGTFGFVWLDVFEPGPGGRVQIHDFEPGIEESGLFWTIPFNEHDIDVNPGNGRARMRASDLEMPDYHDFVNSLIGDSVPGVVSFTVEWLKSRDKRRFRDPVNGWLANMVLNEARIEWTGETETARFESDDIDTSFSLFAEVGRERNGVFFR